MQSTTMRETTQMNQKPQETAIGATKQGDQVQIEGSSARENNDDASQPRNGREQQFTILESGINPANASTAGPTQSQHENRGGVGVVDGSGNDANKESSNSIELFKSTRLKGYITLAFASIINYTNAENSVDVIKALGVIPSTDGQRIYAMSVALVSLILTGGATLVHLDTITPLKKVWVAAFKPKSRFELVLDVFLVIWWSVATGIQTTINGIAGDGKQQYSLYFSCWVCCFTSYWVLERWWVAADFASLKAFITSWPNRSPGWLCILFVGSLNLMWYLDLWKAHGRIDPTIYHRDAEQKVSNQLLRHFRSVQEIQWQLMITLIVFTIAPAAAFVLAEIGRQTKPDGSNEEKTKVENIAEGIVLLTLICAWVPSIIWVTAPDGAASLVGNAYFTSWLLVIFVAETGVWFVHDQRDRIRQALEQKQMEYREKQRQVLEKARAIQPHKIESPIQVQQVAPMTSEDNYQVDSDSDDSNSSFVDALTEF